VAPAVVLAVPGWDAGPPATVDTVVVADAESALSDALREQPQRAAEVSMKTAGNILIEFKDRPAVGAPRLLIL
jgi:hypothetical protein